jgi:hypothetical protein
MKTLKSFLLALLVTALAIPSVQAQSPAVSAVQGVGVSLSSISAGFPTGYVPMIVKYIGSNPAGGTVTVAAGTGDLTFKTGAVGSSSADTTIECPVSGALGGVIDVSDTACNTLGEVVDAINGSANWRAVIVDGLRADNSDNTTGLFFTLSETSASTAKGLALAGETASTFKAGFQLSGLPRDDIRPYLQADGSLNPNPYADQQNFLSFFTEVSTYASGTSAIEVYSVIPFNKTCTYLASSISCTANETATQIYGLAGGASATAPTALIGQVDLTKLPLPGQRGAKLFVRVNNSAVFSAFGGPFVGTGLTAKYIKNQ